MIPYPLKIVILEDNEADAEMIQYVLKKNDYNCQFKVMMTGPEFEQALDEFKPDLILSDNDMPQFSASEALKIVQQNFLHIPFILVTGTVSEEFAASIMKAGADDYLLKDRLTRLPGAIEAALKQKHTEKEKTEATQRLVRSEEKYRTLVEQAFDGIIIYSPDGKILDSNHSACISLGYTQKELKELIVSELFFKEDLMKRPLYFKTLIAGQPTLDYRRLRRKDGTYFEMEIGTKMMPDGNLMAVGRDITERNEAEQKIIQSERNLKAIFDNTSEGFILTDTDGIIKAFNHRTKDVALLNLNEDMVSGRSIFDFMETSRIDFFKSMFSRVIKGETFQYDRSYDVADGQTTWINFTLNPVRKGEDIIGLCLTGRDITGKKNAEQQLKKSFDEKQALAERMSTILNTLPANIALLDEKGMIVEVNGAWRNFADDNGFIGSNYGVGDNYISISKESSGKGDINGKAVAHGINDVLKSKVKEFVYEYPCHSPEVKRWFRMVATPLQEKEYAGAVVMHIDISELRRLEQERLENKMEEQKKITRAIVEAQEKERNQLGRELHDNISQLLAAIKMKLGYCLKNYDKGIPVVTECLDHVQEAVMETRNLSHRMVMPRFAESSFKEALEQLTVNYSNEHRSVLFETNSLEEARVPPGIKETFYRIVQEQLHNIEKYAKATEVSVEVYAHTDHITMIVGDNGVGFDVKKKRKGIGLTNILNRAESYNGSAKIVSEPGAGCTLVIDLPLTVK